MNVLVIFGRSPGADPGKTRLRAVVGEERVRAFVRASTHDTLGWRLPPGATALAVLAGQADAELAGLPVNVIDQCAGSFGQRLVAAVNAGFDSGASQVVIVGTDAPSLPARHVDDLFAGLEDSDATLVPATDGGWIALGVRERLRSSFAEIPWSAGHTRDATIASLASEGRRVRLLDSWYDVDDADGLRRLTRELADGSEAALRAPRTAALVATW